MDITLTILVSLLSSPRDLVNIYEKCGQETMKMLHRAVTTDADIPIIERCKIENLEAIIGKGSFGTVYKGTLLQINSFTALATYEGKVVALKQMHDEEKCQKEAEYLWKMNHPCVLKALGYLKVNDTDHRIMLGNNNNHKRPN